MKSILSVFILLFSIAAYGQEVIPKATPKGINFDTNMLLIIVAVILLLPLRIMAKTFITAAKHYYAHTLKSGHMKILLPLGFIMISTSLFAQGKTSASPFALLNNPLTITLLSLIALELFLIIFFGQKTKSFLQKIESPEGQPEKVHSFIPWLKEKWAAMNFRPIEEEHKIDTGHSYDGIRELDNVIPPWFTTTFILTILFAIVYVYRFQIAKTGPTQIQEYTASVALAELQHDEYLKTQSNSIDENNVMVMTGADLDEGKKTFVTICAACHKVDGGGLVGPNLTDDYWIHGGALKDLFKTIKYGFPEKGMISWKEQLSPSQIAQVANYILTLRGTNPPDAKEKQGTLYVASEIKNDTLAAPATKPDTVKTK